jgi:hypothetical protein
MNKYQELGYSSRRQYLESLADDYGVPIEQVILTANIYGPSEDFDGLVSTVQDIADGVYDNGFFQ